MKAAPLPDNESARLQALASYQLLDSLPEAMYDDVTRVASEICGTPIALLSLVDENRQWFKSKQGIDFNEGPRAHSFCAHAIINPNEVMVVPDARHDERFHDNPYTLGEPQVVFYAGVPVKDEDGHALGTLCVIDSRPRDLPEHKLEALKALAQLVNTYFKLRRNALDLERYRDCILRTEALTQTMEHSLQAIAGSDPRPDQVPQLQVLADSVRKLREEISCLEKKK